MAIKVIAQLRELKIGKNPGKKFVMRPDLYSAIAEKKVFQEAATHSGISSGVIKAAWDAAPLFIDPGVGEYTAKTFSKNRYDIWTMQSGYHNLPQINGFDQKDSKQYAAKIINHRNGLLSLDIATAYPEEAGVKSWKRTVKAMTSGISITEDYELSQFFAPTRLMLMTTNRNAHKHLSYDANQLEATLEDISDKLDPLLQGMWGKEMYRIVLTVKSAKTKQQIRYTIK